MQSNICKPFGFFDHFAGLGDVAGGYKRREAQSQRAGAESPGRFVRERGAVKAASGSNTVR